MNEELTSLRIRDTLTPGETIDNSLPSNASSIASEPARIWSSTSDPYIPCMCRDA
jgi:hypothetical protein